MELSRDVCAPMMLSMLGDQQVSEVACVRLWRSPPDKKDNIVQRSSSDTVLKLMAPGGWQIQRVALRRNFSQPRLSRVQHFPWLRRDQSAQRRGMIQLWNAKLLRLPRLPSLQNVSLGNALTSPFGRTKVLAPASVFVVGVWVSGVIMESTLRHALANPWVQVRPICQNDGGVQSSLERCSETKWNCLTEFQREVTDRTMWSE